MKACIKHPSEYRGAYNKWLERRVEQNPYVPREHWLEMIPHIIKKTNRHTSSDGSKWGWWEVFPFQIEAGYWGITRKDLSDEFVTGWNKEAGRIKWGEGIHEEETS